MEWYRQFLIWHTICKYTDEWAAVNRQPEFIQSWCFASSGCCVFNLIREPPGRICCAAGFFSFASKGMISSNELYNFTTSSKACLQLSSSRLPLATGAGKMELHHQSVLRTSKGISPERQAGHGQRMSLSHAWSLPSPLLQPEPPLLAQP